ncbi:MAG TPA: glycoside hydrolase domain-containing protein [Candidatus Limnocylindrales bacterium]|nr:glycoside hydrolase domain-containing protein [Candidatus Limnocylindrales bacterium]
MSASIGTQTYVLAEGFDTCANVSAATLSAWWNGTPWYVYGTYLGGSGGAYVGCVPMSQATINSAIGQGWALEPFWYGRQMPSSCIRETYPSTISLNTTTAYSQGKSEADSANTAAASFGYGTFDIIYYDLEATGDSSACIAAAKAFVNGWEYELAYFTAYWGGLYGSSCSSNLSSFASIANVPRAIAPRDVNHDPTGVYGLSCLSDSLWDNEQRIHQLAAMVPLMYGGHSLVVDEDCAYGPVDTNSGVDRSPFNCSYVHQ